MTRRKESTPYYENKKCSLYLGVYIAENLLAKTYTNVERMPPGNPDFDFICNKNFKINVKSACVGVTNAWTFTLNDANCDFYLCLAFDDRENLNPQYLWLIPKKEVGDLVQLVIRKSTISRWTKWEQPLDKAIQECDAFKNARQLDMLSRPKTPDEKLGFLDLLGNQSVMRIVEFFIINSPYNYNKTQVILELNMGRNTVFNSWEILEEFGILKAISSDKRTRFYVLNKENKIVVYLLKLFAAIEAN
jgi:hypothetical protein